jgi:hypothetical protein
MKANELRIGNYVFMDTPNRTIKFRSFDELSNVESYPYRFKSIPLTEEWLLKLNAKSTETIPAKNGIWIECEIDNQGCWVSISHGMGIVVVRVDHVHQLQNLYFALTGEELILKL